MQTILLYFLILAISVLGLWFSGDYAVKYSLQIAKIFKLSPLLVGFLLIALSTGIPELAVTFIALHQKVPMIALGDLIGSCIVDIALALGLACLIHGSFKLNLEQSWHASFMLLVIFVMSGISFVVEDLHWSYGIFLIMSYGFCVWWMVVSSTAQVKREAKKREDEAEINLNRKSLVVLKLGLSMVFLLVSADFAIRYSVKIAELLKLPAAIVGATFFSIGTSVPEVVLSISSVRRKQYALAVGTCIGSVLEIITFNLGILVLFSSVTLNIMPLLSVLPYLMIIYAVLIFSLLYRRKLGRVEGAIMLIVFLVYLAYEIWWQK